MSDAVLAVLESAKTLGLLGPGPVSDHLRISEQFAEHLPLSGSIVDLGSGGGVPAFGAAICRPGTTWILVERSQSRTDALSRFVGRLKLADRMRVLGGDAAELAHRPDLRASADAVTARGFAPPLVTAEIAAGFLRADGLLVVSQADDSSALWDAAQEHLAGIGYIPVVSDGPIRVLRMDRLAAPGIPRRRVGRKGS